MSFSTVSCLVQLTDFTLRRMKKGFHTEMILVDLQKAFDTLDHTVLLGKMKKMVSIKSLKLKVFYDTRKCLLRCWTNKLWCSTRIYLRAIPLPNIHINDLPKALNEIGSYLYADDKCIYYQDRDVEKIEKVLNKEFLSLCEWL